MILGENRSSAPLKNNTLWKLNDKQAYPLGQEKCSVSKARLDEVVDDQKKEHWEALDWASAKPKGVCVKCIHWKLKTGC